MAEVPDYNARLGYGTDQGRWLAQQVKATEGSSNPFRCAARKQATCSYKPTTPHTHTRPIPPAILLRSAYAAPQRRTAVRPRLAIAGEQREAFHRRAHQDDSQGRSLLE